MAFPRGSCKASGRKFCGVTGGRFGLGIRKSQPDFQHCGMQGGLQAHQTVNCRCNAGASDVAKSFQTTPGANGRATALVLGIIQMACSSCDTLKGTPGGSGNSSCKEAGPLHVSETNLLSIAVHSTGEAMCPA